MDAEPPKPRRGDLALPGCLITFLVWVLAAYVAVGISVGDCFPTASHACPTDHERNMRLLWVAIAALLLNVALLAVLALGRANRRD